MKAVIMAAGYGTRFLPITKTIAKEMLPIIDKPVIQFTIDELLDAGIDEILIISHRKKKAMEDYFDRDPELEQHFMCCEKTKNLDIIKPPKVKITFIRQHHMGGSADALLLAEAFVGNEAFILAYPDDVVLAKPSLSKQLIDIYNKEKMSILSCEEIQGDVSRFGVVKPGKKMTDNLIQAQGIVEKPKQNEQPSQIISIGRYLLTPKIFPILRECQKKHTNGEFVLTDGLQLLAQDGKLLSYIFTGKRLDVGEPESYIRSLLYVINQSSQYKHLLDEVK